MTLIELGILVIVFILTTWIGAIQIALRDPSRSEIEDRLRIKAADGDGRVASAEWLFRRRPRLLFEVAIVRAVATVAVVSILLGGQEDLRFLISAAAAVLVLWFASSVLADSLANRLGP